MSEEEEYPPLQLNVATFNTGGFGWGPKRSCRPDLEMVKDHNTKMINEFNMDFIGLQEGFDRMRNRRLFSQTLGYVTWASRHQSQELYILYNNRKWTPLGNATRKYEIQSDTDTRPIFGCLFTQTDNPYQTVLVINAHLPHGSYGDLRENVKNAVANVYEAAMSDFGGATLRGIIMTGDFNEFFQGPCQYRGSRCHATIPLPIFSNLQHARHEQDGTLRRHSTDQVLFWSNVHPNTGGETVRIFPRVGSDHKPVWCQFQI